MILGSLEKQKQSQCVFTVIFLSWFIYFEVFKAEMRGGPLFVVAFLYFDVKAPEIVVIFYFFFLEQILMAVHHRRVFHVRGLFDSRRVGAAERRRRRRRRGEYSISCPQLASQWDGFFCLGPPRSALSLRCAGMCVG